MAARELGMTRALVLDAHLRIKIQTALSYHSIIQKCGSIIFINMFSWSIFDFLEHREHFLERPLCT